MAKVLGYLKPTAADRVRGLAAVAGQSARLDASGGVAAFCTARTDEADWLDLAAGSVGRSDAAAVEQAPRSRLWRELLRKVRFGQIGR